MHDVQMLLYLSRLGWTIVTLSCVAYRHTSPVAYRWSWMPPLVWSSVSHHSGTSRCPLLVTCPSTDPVQAGIRCLWVLTVSAAPVQPVSRHVCATNKNWVWSTALLGIFHVTLSGTPQLFTSAQPLSLEYSFELDWRPMSSTKRTPLPS